MDYNLLEGSTWEDSLNLGTIDLVRPSPGKTIPWDGRELRITGVREPALLGKSPKTPGSVLVMDIKLFVPPDAQQ